MKTDKRTERQTGLRERDRRAGRLEQRDRQERLQMINGCRERQVVRRGDGKTGCCRQTCESVNGQNGEVRLI